MEFFDCNKGINYLRKMDKGSIIHVEVYGSLPNGFYLSFYTLGYIGRFGALKTLYHEKSTFV